MQEDYKYIHRDVSWLSFNHRVLAEAKCQSLALYERIKFLAIFSSNLDEFFRVRVASLKKLVQIKSKGITRDLGLQPKKVLKQIISISSQQQVEYGELLEFEILPELAQNGIVLYWNRDPEHLQRKPIRQYFLSRVLSYLQPVLLGGSEEQAPFLENGALYFALFLRDPDGNAGTYALVNIPSNHLPRFLALPHLEGNHHYMFLDDAIRLNLEIVFPGYVVEGCYSVKLNRDASLDLEDEFSGNLVRKIKSKLPTRGQGAPARFLYNKSMPREMLDFLRRNFDLTEDELVPGGVYHNLNDLMQLPNPVGAALEEESWPALERKRVEDGKSIFQIIDDADLIFHFPYHSYDYILRFFNEAAIHPAVTDIKVTLYRVATTSLIVNALISAARNGKRVTVFVEIKARFDEENNLRWAEMMKSAGIRIIYSIPGLKVHAKVALVTKRKEKGKKRRYALFSTGNFNERTARIYTDHGLLTCHKDMTRELEHLFKYLKNKKSPGKLEHLLVSQFNLQEVFLDLIDREITSVEKGRRGKITIKLNNLEDQVMTDALYRAAQKGVQVDLIVRGICVAKPHLPGLNGNLRILRLVDRYLEHGRIFLFHNEGKEKLYLASADWMKRNLYRRIEVAFPIYDAQVRDEIVKALDFQLADNTKMVILDNEGSNIPVEGRNDQGVRAQQEYHKYLRSRN